MVELFRKATDESSGGIATFSNGDIATAFSVSNSNGGSSVIVQRLTTNGMIVWSVDIGADYAPSAGSILVDEDDIIYITGGTKQGSTGESGKMIPIFLQPHCHRRGKKSGTRTMESGFTK